MPFRASIFVLTDKDPNSLAAASSSVRTMGYPTFLFDDMATVGEITSFPTVSLFGPHIFLYLAATIKVIT